MILGTKRIVSKQRKVNGSSRPSQRKRWQGDSVFCRAGNPDRMADETRSAITTLYNEIQRPVEGQVIGSINSGP